MPSSLCPMTNSSTVVGKNVNVVCQFWFMNLSLSSEVFHQGILKATTLNLVIVTLSAQIHTLF